MCFLKDPLPFLAIIHLKALLKMQDGHEEMFLLKRSSRSLCNLCATFPSRTPVKKLVSSTVGSAHRAPLGAVSVGWLRGKGRKNLQKDWS